VSRNPDPADGIMPDDPRLDLPHPVPEAPCIAAAVPAELRSRAVKLLTNREHSRSELGAKLRRRGYPDAAVEAALDDLEHSGLLSEARMLPAYVRERLEKGFGPVRIRLELREKGLSDARIGPHLQLSDDELLARLDAACRKRFGHAPPADGREQAKRSRFLEYRGFPRPLIARYLNADVGCR
jgi:regulatory protein